MKPVLFLAATLPFLMLAPAARATPWRADAQAVGVSDKRIADCTSDADAKKLKGFEREKYIKSCSKGSN
ncbi:MAG: hypothetical protein ACYC1L_15910 [Alphaproteobacteria bacterium]